MAKRFQVDSGGTMTTNLIAYYMLEDATEYYEGSGTYDLTNNGTVTFSSGKVNNAANYGDPNTTKYLSSAQTFGIDGGNMSCSMWVKFSTAPTNTTVVFWYQYNDTSKVEYLVFYDNALGVNTLTFRRNRSGTAVNEIVVTTTLSAGTWYHLVLTYDGSTLEGWLNGSSQGTVASSGSGSSTAGGTGLQLSGHFGNANLVRGLEDECGIWSKKLSNTEVSDLYNGGSGQTMTDAPLPTFIPRLITFF